MTARHGIEELLRIGVFRRVHDLPDRPALDDTPGLHHDDPVGDAFHHAEVVGDDDEAHAALALDLLQEVEHLRFDGYVERAGRLVGDQQVGLQRDRRGDHDALPLPAGELVRIVAGPALRVGNADAVEQLQHPAPGRHLVDTMDTHRLRDLPADWIDRVKRGQRVLEDHRDGLAVDLLPLRFRHPQEVLAAQQDLAGGDDGRRRVDEVHHRRGADALARSALAEDGEGLALVDRPADAVDRLDRAPLGGELDAEVLHLEKGCFCHDHSAAVWSRHRSTGSVAMRSQLEKRLSDIVTSMIARPGQKATHHAEPM